MPLDPPGNAAMPPGWTDLEGAHEQLRQAARLLETAAEPVVDLRGPADELQRVFAAVFEAFDGVGHPHQAISNARVALQRAMDGLSAGASQSAAIGFALENLGHADRALVRAADRMAMLPVPAEPAPSVLRASVHLPRLHDVQRSRLVPALKVPEPPPAQVVEPPYDPLPTPDSFEQLADIVAKLRERAEARRKAAEERAAERKQAREPQPKAEEPAPPEGFSADPLPAVSEEQFTLQRTRECFEEVAMVGIHRAPITGDPWRTALVLEQRMFNNVDAIVSMGPVALGQIEALVLDTPVRDPSRAWAATLILGSVTGRDALAVAERVFYAVESATPEAYKTFAEALKIVPNPFVPLLLQKLAQSPSSAHRALAIDVLAHRRLASEDELARAALDEPEVAATALPIYALSGHHGVRPAIDRAMMVDDDRVREAAWLAMAYASHPRTQSALYAELGTSRGAFAAKLLAIAGNGEDAARLLEHTLSSPTPALVDAVGWAGAADAIPRLLDLMRRGDAKLNVLVAEALERITGARLTEEVTVPPEELEEPAVPEPNTGEPPDPPLAELVSDPRDLPEHGSPDHIERPTTDHGRWQAYYQANRERLLPGQRYRRGTPYSALVTWNELDQGPCNPDERRWLQRELIIRSGAFVPLDPCDLVAQQLLALKEWEAPARSASVRQGFWNTPRRAHYYKPL